MLIHRNQFHYGIVRVLHSARILSIIDFPGAVVLGSEQEAVVHISSGQTAVFHLGQSAFVKPSVDVAGGKSIDAYGFLDWDVVFGSGALVHVQRLGYGILHDGGNQVLERSRVRRRPLSRKRKGSARCCAKPLYRSKM